jgi:hypothetical protein
MCTVHMNMQDSCRDLVAVLMSFNQLCIWNAEAGIKIKSFVFDVNAHSMSLDPFNSARMLCKYLLDIHLILFMVLFALHTISHMFSLFSSVFRSNNVTGGVF